MEYLKFAYKTACEQKNENLKLLLKRAILKQKNKEKGPSFGCFSCFSK